MRSVLILTLLAFGCGEDASTDASAPAEPDLSGDKADSYYSCGVVNYPDEGGFAGHSVTSKRVQALTKYANDLLACTQPYLDKTFSRRGVDAKAIAQQYEIRVEGEDCFNELDRWGYNDDLKSDDDLEKMQQQARSVVSFARAFHEDLNGYPNRMFDVITLCPDHIIDGVMKLEGRQLYIGVDRGAVLGGLKPATAQDIRGHWSEGEQLGDQFGFLKKLWFVLDPAGTPRIALREAIRQAAQGLADKLRDAGDGMDTENLRAELAGLALDNVVPGYTAEGEEAEFGTQAARKIEQLDDAALRQVADDWASYVEHAEHWDKADVAAAAMHESVARNAINLDVEQWGLFTFANFHDINVSADFFFPADRAFMRYVKLEQVDWDVKVRQYSLISIWTSDNVDVKVSVSVDRAVQTAGLERALQRLPTP